MANKLPLFTLKPTKDEIEEGVKEYFEENGGSADEPLLAAHLTDETPHPVYDNLASGRFVAILQNGMA